jgi:hypothetical protein
MAPRKSSTQETTTDVDYAEPPRGVNWAALIVGLLLFCVFFTGCTGVLGGAAYYFYGRVDADGAKPKPDSRVELVQSIEDAGISSAHAVYFSKVCTGVANRLDVDADSKAPVFDQRKEAVDLVGLVGSLAVAGNDAANYKRLPDVIEDAFEDVWESDKDGKLKAGPLTKDDHKEVVTRWRKLATAFTEVAN